MTKLKCNDNFKKKKKILHTPHIPTESITSHNGLDDYIHPDPFVNDQNQDNYL